MERCDLERERERIKRRERCGDENDDEDLRLKRLSRGEKDNEMRIRKETMKKRKLGEDNQGKKREINEEKKQLRIEQKNILLED